MKYVFVLQWPSSSMDVYDSMVEIEKALIGALSRGNRLDGHDVGSGEVNIFIETNNPNQVFDEVRGILIAHHAWSDVRIAYRTTDGDHYTVLWPKTLREFEVR